MFPPLNESPSTSWESAVMGDIAEVAEGFCLNPTFKKEESDGGKRIWTWENADGGPLIWKGSNRPT